MPADLDRRGFLRRSLAVAPLAAAAPYWHSQPACAQGNPDDRPGIALIGAGPQGSALAQEAVRFARILACADVDQARGEAFATRQLEKCEVVSDYRHLLDRTDIDAVIIATPDHWHAKIAIEAMHAGKDIYCEKPLSLTIDEGKQVCRVARETKRVVQMGTQQRSSTRFLAAVALARSGRLGSRVTAVCTIGTGPAGGPFQSSQPSKTLNWDMWLGQAPRVPFTRERCHGYFRWWLEYSGGKLTDWGAHHVDIAQWAIGCEDTGPIDVEGVGKFPALPEDFDPAEFFAGRVTLPNSYNTATTFNVTMKFANGSSIRVRHGDQNGIWLRGGKSQIFVNRGEISGELIESLTAADKRELYQQIGKLYKGKAPTSHMANFFECVRDRTEPVADVFSHHRHISSCHLANIAMLLKRKLAWDPHAESFIGDDQATRLLSRPQRERYLVGG
ncbi:MAG: Gfo/Idh/MocA family protein [Planctomycetota bacterium]